jgi:hypothetical protein
MACAAAIFCDVTTVPQQSPFRGHIRLQQWERVSYGVYGPARPRPLAENLAAWQLVLPRTAAFSHLTAARLSGWWLPASIEHPVFAAMTTTAGGPHRPGLFVCRHPKPVAINLVDGLRVTTGEETLLAAARDLGVLDLVIMADSALRLGHCTLTSLKIVAGQHRRGGPLLRRVIPLLDARSESAWESVMRVLHRAAEIPATPQYEIFDAAGHFVARADLWIQGTRRIHEYDGAVHRDGKVHESDLTRDRALVAAGWQRYGYTAGQLLNDGAALIAEVDRLLGRAWEPQRRTAWEELISHSLFGRPGRARAHRQWRRAMEACGPTPSKNRRQIAEIVAYDRNLPTVFEEDEG